MTNNEDIIKLVINPPIPSSASSSVLEKVKIQTSILIALTLEAIWNFHNQVVHDDTKPHILTTIKNLEHRIMEHVDATTLQNEIQPKEKPPHGTIKLNTDVALLGFEAALAVIAKDNNGAIIWAETKKVLITNPAVAEAFALLWATQLVVSKKLQHCIIEGDAKTCIDACNGSIEDCPWPLYAICLDVKTLPSSLPFVVFYWVRIV